ncbi:MAG: type II secretion system F family protein [Desulfobacteraceae bacterium]|nr:type II secretion system F family protein [Desulfobacteraceae bacterium]
MPRFSYKAINETGNTMSGSIEAESREAAAALLGQRGYIPSKVSGESNDSQTAAFSTLQERFTHVKAADLILFTKQFRTMVRAGLSIIPLLHVLENQTENPKLRTIIGSMGEDIKGGSTLYDAFKKHPKVFSPLYCIMIQAGESSGALGDVMERLIYIIGHEHKIRSDIRSALQYPIIVAIFLAIAFFVLLTFVIPKFTTIFLSAGVALPLPTQICMLLYNILSNYWFLVLGVVAAGIVGLVSYLKTEQGKYMRDLLVLRVPIFGPLVIKSAMSRFASIFAILQSSGIHVLESLKILSGTIGNAAIAKEFDRIRDRVEQGRGISGPLKSAKYFSPMVINMVTIGEESGKLEELLREVATHYDDEVEYATNRLSEAIGPLLTVGLAAVVGFFAIAIFLPMWDLTKMVH